MTSKYVFYLCLMFLLLHSSCQCAKTDVFGSEYIDSTIVKVIDWQMKHPKHDPRDWTNAALYSGMYAAWEVTHSNRIYELLMNVGESVEWQPFSRWYHADDIAVCQTYIDLYRREGKAKMIQPTIDTLNMLINQPYPQKRPHEVIKWWWCDALFMAPPVLVKLGMSTGDEKYLKISDKYYEEAYNLLYDNDEKLFSRDLNYVIKNNKNDKREANGRKIFWSRGNGWVMGGLVKILTELPDTYSKREFYETLFKEMAERVITLQQEDGLWRVSLLDPQSYPGGEVSGSGFFCYALAWGINNKLLDKNEYLPIVKKAWIALNQCVDEEGRIGWVQPIGADPRKNFNRDSWEVYGTGAFLLAASEVVKLK